MSALHRYTYGSRGHQYVFIQNLVRLVNHLHLFLRITSLQERVDMRKDVLVYRIWIHGRIFAPFLSSTLGLHLIQCLVAGTGHRLIGGNHYPLYLERFVKRSQWHQHLYGRTVRIRNDIVICSDDISVDFRHDQFLRRVHPPA